jgi:hypothetical protein
MFKATHIVNGKDNYALFPVGHEVMRGQFYANLPSYSSEEEYEPNYRYVDSQGAFQIIGNSGVDLIVEGGV